LHEIDVVLVEPIDEVANRHHRTNFCRSAHLPASVRRGARRSRRVMLPGVGGRFRRPRQHGLETVRSVGVPDASRRGDRAARRDDHRHTTGRSRQAEARPSPNVRRTTTFGSIVTESAGMSTPESDRSRSPTRTSTCRPSRSRPSSSSPPS
jgi:hypothetical protein